MGTRRILMALGLIGAYILIAGSYQTAQNWQRELQTEAEAIISLNTRAEAIDAYYRAKNMPLAGYGEKFVTEADKNGIDWRLLPAIAVRESSGGIHACGANPFGWASCKRSFNTIEEAITSVSSHLGGNNENTAHYYSGKSTEEILKTYNPPSIVPTYAEEVISIMDQIAPR